VKTARNHRKHLRVGGKEVDGNSQGSQDSSEKKKALEERKIYSQRPHQIAREEKDIKSTRARLPKKSTIQKKSEISAVREAMSPVRRDP